MINIERVGESRQTLSGHSRKERDLQSRGYRLVLDSIYIAYVW